LPTALKSRFAPFNHRRNSLLSVGAVGVGSACGITVELFGGT